jgi:hypothetical protein
VVGLEERPLSEEELVELLEEFEEWLRKGVVKRLRRRLEQLDLVVEAELLEGGRRLRLRVDARAAGRLIAPFSYDEVLAEAIDEAARWLEQRLRSRGLAEGSGEATRPG